MSKNRLRRTWSISLNLNLQKLGSNLAKLRFHNTKTDMRRRGGLTCTLPHCKFNSTLMNQQSPRLSNLKFKKVFFIVIDMKVIHRVNLKVSQSMSLTRQFSVTIVNYLNVWLKSHQFRVRSSIDFCWKIEITLIDWDAWNQLINQSFRVANTLNLSVDSHFVELTKRWNLFLCKLKRAAWIFFCPTFVGSFFFCWAIQKPLHDYVSFL